MSHAKWYERYVNLREWKSLVRPIGPYNEIVVPLRVPYFAKESDDIVAAVPELEAYLKAKYPRVKEVRFR